MHKQVVIGIGLVLLGCGKSLAPSPMKNEAMVSTQKLKLGILDLDSHARPGLLSGFLACADQFPAIEVVDPQTLTDLFQKIGARTEDTLKWGDDFNNYASLRLGLLLIAYQVRGTSYLRIVNYFGKYVSTVVLSNASQTCSELLLAQRLLVIESHPLLADVKIDHRPIGEAPVWTWLRDGSYRITCQLPGQVFQPVNVSIPASNRVLCQRENIERGPSAEGNSDDKVSTEEGIGAVIIYIVGAAASIAAILLPILFLF